MVLSNVAIRDALRSGRLVITPPPPMDISKNPYSTMSIDFHLDVIVEVPNRLPIAIDLTSEEKITKLIKSNSQTFTLSMDQPYRLKPKRFVLAKTKETVGLPICKEHSLSARVEGKSSVARCGLLIHFTAPTIHNGWNGPIALEIINHGINDFLLTPEMSICQLLFEEVQGEVVPTEGSQFMGQTRPSGAALPEPTPDQEAMAVASFERQRQKAPQRRARNRKTE